jgi:hypothetical protein
LPVERIGSDALAISALLQSEALTTALTLLSRRISERDLVLAISQQLALDVHQRVEQMAGQFPPDEGDNQTQSDAIRRNLEQMAGQFPPLRRKVKGVLVAERPVKLALERVQNLPN